MMKFKIQQGFSLITAIFVLVVLASLGAMMTTFFAAQQQSSALDAIGGRAHQAARAGIEWGAFQITQSGIAGATFATLCQPGPTGSQVALSGALSDFGVDVQCSAASAVEGGNAVWVYDITATASGVHGAVPGNADYAERRIQASVRAQDAIASQVIMWK